MKSRPRLDKNIFLLLSSSTYRQRDEIGAIPEPELALVKGVLTGDVAYGEKTT